MKIKYTCPFWGSEDLSAVTFLDKVLFEWYDGIEINLPEDKKFIDEFFNYLSEIKKTKPEFRFIAQQVLPPARESVDEYIERMKKRLNFNASFQPHHINSHTGKDFFSFEENCRVIDAANEISIKTGIPIYHETHRGRFSFHAKTLLNYLKKFPEIKLVGDFSHFCTVSESLLNDQEEIMNQIIPHVSHIHARVGFEQGPQVNDPNAPEWESHLHTFISWWKIIIENKTRQGYSEFIISPEYGPAPYMPVLPYSCKPLSDQWTNNTEMMNLLKKELL